jgi:hypothetical protein
MTWNYRIVKRKNETMPWFALHEVFYNKKGEAWAMTNDPIEFICGDDEGPNGIISSMSMALADAIQHPVFEEPDKWADQDEVEK